MSAHLAIPATTTVIKAIVESWLKKVYGALVTPPVSVEPPPRPSAPTPGNATAEAASLTVFMHHASPNGSWRNMYDPNMDGAGKRASKAPLVLDLHYVLAAFGSDLEREALLGIGMSALHRNGVVPRKKIEEILTTISPPQFVGKLIDNLTAEPLHKPANQLEANTISQQAFDLDMSTKLWSALQSPIRPCAYYLVSTVFLDTGEVFPAAKTVDEVVIAGRPDPDPAAGATNDAVITTTGG